MQPKKEVAVAAPIMHPLFANAEPTQVPPQNNMGMTDPTMNQGMYGQPQQPTMNTGNYYQPPQQQQQQQHDHNVINNNQINYSNFSQFPGAQTGAAPMTYPIAEPVQPAKEVPREKPPLPEEFIHFQTVFEELKNQCITRANNPVRNFTFSIYVILNIFFYSKPSVNWMMFRSDWSHFMIYCENRG